jgi:hypothetical protein
MSSRALPRLLAAVFPGDRRVWLWSLLAVLPMAALIAYNLATPRAYYTGTDSVGQRSIVAELPPGGRLCVPNITIPGGTGAIALSYATPTAMRGFGVTVSIGGRIVARGSLAVLPSQPANTQLGVPIAPPLPTHPQASGGTVCFTAGHGSPLALAGFAGLPTDATSPTINGRPTHAGISLWFLPPHGETRSLAANWSAMMRRLALFRPGFASDVFYWLLFVLALPLLCYVGLRLLAVANRPGRRLALGLAGVAVAGAAFWAITTVPFDSPDESEHFAYTESIAETGRAPDTSPTSRSPYASDELFALDALDHFGEIEIDDTRPPWFSRDQSIYRHRVAVEHPSRTDGGGFTAATHLHSPLYYSLLVPGYELGHSGGVFTELFWMRLTSALLGAIVVLAAYGTMRELVPSRPELAVGAGLLVAFQPMFSFIAGAVNNDNGVNALAALAVYLTIRALRRGLTWRLGAALGATAALLPVMKGTGEALWPAIIVALAGLVMIRRSRTTFVGLGVTIASFAAVAAIWGALASLFHRSVAASATTGVSVVASGGQLGGKLVYLWEVFFPRLPFMSSHWDPSLWPFSFIYVKRGFAAFGWYAIFFPTWVYHVIIAVILACGALALVMAVRRRRIVASRWLEALFLILVILAVIGGVEFAFYSPVPRIPLLIPEQGRYAFTAIVPLAALALAGLLALPRKWATPLVAVLVGAMICFNAASHLLYIAQTFT